MADGDDGEIDIAQALAARVTDPVVLVYDENVRVGPPDLVNENQSITGAHPPLCVYVQEVTLDDNRDIPFKADADTPAASWPREEPTEYIVIVRGKPGQYTPTRALALAVFRALDKHLVPGYFETRCSRPRWFTERDGGHELFSMRVDMKRDVVA